MEGGPSKLAILAFDSLTLFFSAFAIFEFLTYVCKPLGDIFLVFSTRLQIVHRLINPHRIFLCPKGLSVHNRYTIVIVTTIVIHKLLDMSRVLTCPPTLSYDKGIGFS